MVQPPASPHLQLMDADVQSRSDDLTAGELQHRAARGAMWTSLATLVTVPIAFLSNLVVTRRLGPANYGELALLALVLAWATAISHAGVGNSVIRWGAVAAAKGNDAGVKFMLEVSLAWHLFVQAPLLTIVVLALGWGHGPFVLAGLVVGVVAPCALGGAALAISIENRTAAGAKVALATVLGIQGAPALAALFTRDPFAVWAASLFGSALFLPFNLFALPRKRWRDTLRIRFPRALPAGFWTYSLFTAAAALIRTIIGTDSEIYVLKLHHLILDVGYFALAFGIAAQVTAPVDGFLGPLLPAAVGLLAAAPQRAAQGFLRALRLSTVLAGLTMAALVPVLAYLIPVFYGPRFQHAAKLFVPLGIASCAVSMLNVVTAFVFARGRGRLIFVVTVVVLAVDGGLAFALVPVIGVWGAVIANIAATVVPVIVWLSYELSALSLTWRTTASVGTAWVVSALACAAALGIGHVMPGSALPKAISAGTVGTAAFILGLRVSRSGLHAEDTAVVLRLLPNWLARMLAPIVGILARP
jgi:O-antigen/teichoic acid export membrane protein